MIRGWPGLAARAPHRLSIAALIAIVAWAVARRSAPDAGGPLLAVLAAYVSGAAGYLALLWTTIARSSATTLARRAGTDDPGRSFVAVIVVASSAIVVGGALALLRDIPASDSYHGPLFALTLAATVLAWVVTNSVLALHYAHLHYRQAEAGSDSTDAVGQGFVFPGTQAPDGLDFAYLAFTVGMTFQVSDVQVADPRCRRAVLRHALLAFAYNTVLIAFVVNVLLLQVQR